MIPQNSKSHAASFPEIALAVADVHFSSLLSICNQS
jgi:hypothetical protein